MGNNKFKGVFNWSFFTVVVTVIILVNIIVSFFNYRYDFTEDQRYSLTKGSKDFLSNSTNFSDRISIKIYLEGNLPAEIKRFKFAIEDKLKEFKEYAGNRIEYVFIDPNEGTEEDKNALFNSLYAKGKGILPMDLMFSKDGSQQQMMLWPGAEIDFGGSTVSHIQLLPGTPSGKFYTLNSDFELKLQNSINNLEYMLISGIRRATLKSKPKIGFLQGHGELTYAETQRVRTLISPYYSVQDVFLNDSLDALKDIKGLVIARPTKTFSDKDKYIIDQFVMKGGRLMCFIDKLYIPEDSLSKNGYTHTLRNDISLDKMLFDYGVKIEDNLVFDVQCAPRLIPTANQMLIPWFFAIRTTPTSHPIARNIEPVLLRYASQVKFVGNSSNVKSSILTSSMNSSVTGLAPLISLIMYKNYGENPRLVTDIEDESNKICLAGIVEGNFESHFKNRIVDAFAKNPSVGYKEKSVREGKVLVVANGRFIANKYDSMPDKKSGFLYRAKPFNELKMDETMAMMNMQPLVYGNQEFFQNIVDYMLGDNSVLDIRSKQVDIHELDKEKVKLESGYYKMLNLILPSLIILVLALLLFYIRKRKYTRN